MEHENPPESAGERAVTLTSAGNVIPQDSKPKMVRFPDTNTPSPQATAQANVNSSGKNYKDAMTSIKMAVSGLIIIRKDCRMVTAKNYSCPSLEKSGYFQLEKDHSSRAATAKRLLIDNCNNEPSKEWLLQTVPRLPLELVAGNILSGCLCGYLTVLE